MITNSESLYKDLSNAYESVKEQLPGTHIYMTSWCGYLGDPYFSMEVRSKNDIEVKVKGKHLQEMVIEAQRRLGFETRQIGMQLISMVDATATEVEKPDPEPEDKSKPNDVIEPAIDAGADDIPF